MLPTRSLPTHYTQYSYTSLTPSSGSVSGSSSFPPISFSTTGALEYIWRLFNFSQMDFQFAATQLADLLRSPSEVYKTTSIRHSIKSQWSRDDPAILLVLLIFSFFSSIAYTVTFNSSDSISSAFIIMLLWPILSVIVFGVIVATLTHAYASNLRTIRLHTTHQQIEYLYSFDIHLNAWFPSFCILSPIQFLLIPFLLNDSLLANILSSSLHLGALAVYMYITFLGYSALPFIEHAERLLYPLLPAILLFPVLLIFNINISTLWLSLLYGDFD